MSLQAEGGDGDQNEEQRRKGNELEERKEEKQIEMCVNNLKHDSVYPGTGYVH